MYVDAQTEIPTFSHLNEARAGELGRWNVRFGAEEKGPEATTVIRSIAKHEQTDSFVLRIS
jgi:hypothetical protein